MTIAALSQPVTGIAPERFKQVFRNHPAGVVVVTVDGGSGPAGFTATSLTSLSLTPPLVMVSLDKKASTHAAFDFAQKLSDVKSPSAFVELSTEHARKQLETLTEQIKQLAAIAQKVTLATAEPFKSGVAKAFNKAA